MLQTSLSAQQDLGVLNDEFNQESSLQDWKSFHSEEGWPDHTLKMDVNQSTPGHFHLEPQTGFWFGEVHAGPYYFKEVEGDFTVVTRVKVEGRNTDVPIEPFSLAGLLVRSPRPEGTDKFEKGKENWLFITTGYAKGKNEPQFETKFTVNSKSKLIIYPSKSGYIELAISRLGSNFLLSYRYPNGEWQLLRRIEHPNMGQLVQVGFLSYTDFNKKMKRRYIFSRNKLNTTVYTDGQPDMIARFDYIRFSRPDQEAEKKIQVANETLFELLNLK